MPKLSDTQAVLLAAAAARADLNLLPLPVALKLNGAALERTLGALLGRGLIAEAVSTERDGPSTRADAEVEPSERKRLVITAIGLDALGIDTQQAGGCSSDTIQAPQAIPEPQRARPGGKLGALLDAVSRPEGATLEDLSAAASWQPHTTRAAISRLRQRGYGVRIATMGTRKAYHLVLAV